jgi:hypothetical protein
MKHKKIISVVVALLLVVTITGVALAVERITNGGFEVDVSGWSTYAGTITHETTTVHTGNGAATITNTSAATGNSSGGGRQCVDIPTSDSGDYFTAKGWIYVPEGMPTNFTGAYIRVQYYTQDNCSSATGSGTDSALITTSGSWQEVTNIAPVPASAESVQVRLYVSKSDNSANPTVYFDDITFYDSNSNAVHFSGLQAQSPLSSLSMIALAVAGIFVLRKRH